MNYSKIDPKIIHDIKKINSFPFVTTKLSCQGHFCKSPKPSMIYYNKRIKDEDQRGMGGQARWSRFKSPFVALKFVDKRHRKEFISFWIMNRIYL